MRLKTRSGAALYPIGIGTWGFGGTWEAEYGKEGEAAKAINYSISKGQNHIDSAEIYGGGHTDEVVGKAIKDLNREDLFLTDKVWETSVANGKVRPAVEKMLKKLDTDYLDALYIHKPWDNFPWREAIPQINQLIDEGIVRYFGVSNFDTTQLKETTSLSKHPVSLIQLYFNVLHKQDVTEEMQKFCESNGTQIIAYRPLERGMVLEDKTIQTIAKKHNALPSQIALAWLISQGAFPIPQATGQLFIDQNIAATTIKLSSQEIAQLNSL